MPFEKKIRSAILYKRDAHLLYVVIYIKGHLSAELSILFLNGYCRSGLINTSVIVPGPPHPTGGKKKKRKQKEEIPTISSGFLSVLLQRVKEGGYLSPHH
jgi:hypothetical protein